jgi:hypothetical protein
VLAWARRHWIFGVALVVSAVVGFGAGVLSLQPPLRPECDRRSRAYDPKHNKCEGSESLWQRTTDDPVAFFTFWLVCATGVLAVVSVFQGWMLVQQTELGRAEFIATQRPKLIVRAVYIEPNVNGFIQYSIVNIGGSRATIIESWILAEIISSRGAPQSLLPTGHSDLGRLTFAPGEFRDLSYLINDGTVQLMLRLPNNRFDFNESQPGGDLYFSGALVYEDDVGNRRRSVFRRKWDMGGKGFLRVADPDLEYAD